MPEVTVIGYDTFEVEYGKKLVLALEDNGVPIMHRCGGHGRCTSCRVELLDGEFDDLMMTTNSINGGIDDNLRLSCQIRVTHDLIVRPIMTANSLGGDSGPRPADD